MEAMHVQLGAALSGRSSRCEAVRVQRNIDEPAYGPRAIQAQRLWPRGPHSLLRHRTTNVRLNASLLRNRLV